MDVVFDGGVPLPETEVAAGPSEDLIACKCLDGVYNPGIGLDEEGMFIKVESHVDRAKTLTDRDKHREGSDARGSVSSLHKSNVAAAVVDTKIKSVVLGKRMFEVTHAKEVKILRWQMMLHTICLNPDSCATKIFQGLHKSAEVGDLVSSDEGSGEVTEEDLVPNALKMMVERLLELRCYPDEGCTLTNEDPISEVIIILDVGNGRMAD